MDDDVAIIKEAIGRGDSNALTLALENLDELVHNYNLRSIDKKTFLDIKLKECILSLLVDAAQPETLLSIVTFSFELARKDLCAKTLPPALLSDIFESTPINQCEKMFEFVENHLDDWRSKEFDTHGHLLLRLGNDLLRRLSCSTDTVFCGRILVLLARYLPLLEKSGLNSVSLFNVDNVTTYDALDSSFSLDAEKPEKKSNSLDMAGESMDVEEGEMDENESSIMVDHNLYCKFWQLQSFFASPLTCYDKFGWKKFSYNTVEVLSVFASYKLEDTGPAFKRPRLSTQSVDNSDRLSVTGVDLDSELNADGQTRTYFAKYLTSPKLLQLQLSDNNFRRYILVQFLILFQYLMADVRFKDKKIHALNEDQIRFVVENRGKCFELLKQTYPGGPKFADAIKLVLDREERWNHWKNTNCEDFTKNVEPDQLIKFRRRAKEKYEDNPLNMGNAYLTKLWSSCPDNYDACKAVERQFIPDLETFVEKPIEEADPQNEIDDKYKLVADENFQWRALRLMALKSPCFYNSKKHADGTAKFVEKVLLSTAKDLPKFKEIVTRIEKMQAEKASSEPKLRRQINGTLDAVGDETPSTHEDGESQSQIQLEFGIVDNLVSESQVTSLSSLISKDWPKLLEHVKLSLSSDVVKGLKKATPEKACSTLLNIWCATEGSLATVKQLRNILLTAELFNEEVGIILHKLDDNDVGSVRSEVTGGESTEERVTPLLDEDAT